jgi:hypothetical protein
MTDTAHDHPLVRDYLRRLDLAFASLPAERAKELREQITAHLDDELAPGAPDDQVADALRRLGQPADLATEARSNLAPVATAADAAHWLRSAIAGRTWKFWTILTALVILAGATTWYFVSVETAPVLGGVENDWYYPQDQLHATQSSAEETLQSTVALRPRQWQGYYVSLWNYSSWTQTITGYAARSDPAPAAPFGGKIVFDVSTVNAVGPNAIPNPSVKYNLPVSIPPNQSRIIRVLWVSTDSCFPKGGETGVDQLVLTVRIGWTTRTEVIPLTVGMYLLGTKNLSCPAAARQ